MTSRTPRILLPGLTALVAACATLPEITQKLEARPSCCKSMSEFSYERLNVAQNVAFTLNESSAVFAFEAGKSYFKAFAVPPPGGARLLSVRSRPTGSITIETRKWSQVYCPQATFLDAEFRLITSGYRIPAYMREAQTASFISRFNIPSNTRYVVLHTDPRSFGQIATRSTDTYAVGGPPGTDRDGDPILHPCGPVADADVELR